MQLLLNKQEIIDGVCVAVANRDNARPKDVVVNELGYDEKHGFYAEARCYSCVHELDGDEIAEGIVEFLYKFHKFDPELMSVTLHYHDDEDQFIAEVLVNEEE
ncbi:DUF2653 family protein [Priestia megaterium]